MRIDRLRIDGFGHFADVELALSPGLNVIFGSNEAGKSTLLAFIRGVLFGFRRRTDPGRYEPARGDFGGELLLSTPAGPLWVRREGGRRYEGELVVRSPTGERLGPSALVEALSGISRDLFFQVFAFGLAEVASFRELAAQGSVSEALFAAGMRGARRLPQAVEELRKSSEAIFGSKGSKRELNRLLLELESIQQRLGEIGNRPALYAQAVAQLEAIDAELECSERRCEALTAERDLLSKLCAAAGPMARLEEVESQLRSLPRLEAFPVDGAVKLDELLNRMAQVRAEADAAKSRTAALSQELARAALPEELTAQEPRLRSELDAFQSRLEQFRSLADRRATLEQRQVQVISKLKALGMERALSELCSLDLARGRERMLRLRDDVIRFRAAVERAEYDFSASAAAACQQDLALQRLAAERDRLGRSAPRNFFPTPWSLAGVLVLAVLAAAAGLAFGSMGIAAALAALIAGAALWALQRRVAKLQGAEWKDRLSREIEAGSAASAKLLAEQASAQEAVQGAQGNLAAAYAEVDALLAAHRMPSGLGAEGAVDLFNELAALQQRAWDLKAEEERLAADELPCARAAQAVMASAERLRLSADKPENAAAALATLLDRIRDAQQDQRRLSEALQAKLGETSRLEQSLGQAEDAVARLLQQGGCADEKEFRQRDEQAGSFRRLCGEAAELALRIEAGTGLSLASARTAVEERKGFDGLSASLTSVVSQLGDLSGKRNDLSERRGHLLGQLEAWEADEEIHALRQREEALRLKAVELSQRYAVDRLALALLAEARRGHEKDQQPRIIQLASRIFQELTAGRYHQIYTSVEERGTLFVCDAGGRDWPAEQLSRGTREQLFFAFRLAVVEEFGEARCRLPLIVDDVLVNFDPERARRAAQVLARLSSRQQVVAFTCHPRLRDLFASQGGRVVEIDAQERLHSAIGSSVAESA